MKNHRWILHIITPTRTAPVRDHLEILPADPLIWAVRGILITALVLASLCAGAKTFPNHSEAGLANAHDPAGNTHLTVSTNPARPGHIYGPPWMY